jgi:hypothetical protein
MNALIVIQNYDPENVILYDAIKHTSMLGFFVKIQYTTSRYSLNAIYLYIPCDNIVRMTNYIEYIKVIEEQLLERIQFPNNQPQYNLYSTIKKNASRFLSYNTFVSIKITGIWIQHTSYGLSYKIIQ